MNSSTKVVSTCLLTVLYFSLTASYSAAMVSIPTGNSQLKALLNLDTESIRTMTATPFNLKLLDSYIDNASIEEIRCNLIMPAMPMPTNTPAVKITPNGFVGEMVFTMAGHWRAIFILKLKDGREEELSVDIEKVLLK